MWVLALKITLKMPALGYWYTLIFFKNPVLALIYHTLIYHNACIWIINISQAETFPFWFTAMHYIWVFSMVIIIMPHGRPAHCENLSRWMVGLHVDQLKHQAASPPKWNFSFKTYFTLDKKKTIKPSLSIESKLQMVLPNTWSGMTWISLKHTWFTKLTFHIRIKY